jgi:two-component system C4-dicarboxylate transport response regulator DctD
LTLPSVLIVDDDRALLETSAAVLEDEFEVMTAARPSLALEMLNEYPFAVISSDFKMHGMGGVCVLLEAKRLRPGLAGTLATGLRDRLPAAAARDDAVFSIVYKPYTPETLIKSIEDALRLLSMKQAVTRFASSSSRLRGKPVGE